MSKKNTLELTLSPPTCHACQANSRAGRLWRTLLCFSRSRISLSFHNLHNGVNFSFFVSVASVVVDA